MSFELRNHDRYGIFKANSDIGEIKIDISIYGFGEQISISKNNKVITHIDTLDEDDYYDETDEFIQVSNIKVYKPFLKCLKNINIFLIRSK